MKRVTMKNLLLAMLIAGGMYACKNSSNEGNEDGTSTEQMNTNEPAIDNSGSLSPDGTNMSPPDTMGMGTPPDVESPQSPGTGTGTNTPPQ